MLNTKNYSVLTLLGCVVAMGSGCTSTRSSEPQKIQIGELSKFSVKTAPVDVNLLEGVSTTRKITALKNLSLGLPNSSATIPGKLDPATIVTVGNFVTDSPGIDIYSRDTEVIDMLSFGKFAALPLAPRIPQAIEIYAGNPGVEKITNKPLYIAQADATELKPNSKNLVLTMGDSAQTGKKRAQIVSYLTQDPIVDQSNAYFRIVNASTAMDDISLNFGEKALVEKLDFTRSSNFFQTEPGMLEGLSIRNKDKTVSIDVPAMNLQPGAIVTVVVSGNSPTALTVTNVGETAKPMSPIVRIYHAAPGIPGVDVYAAPSVAVAGSAEVFSNLTYKSASKFAPMYAANRLSFDVFPATSAKIKPSSEPLLTVKKEDVLPLGRELSLFAVPAGTAQTTSETPSLVNAKENIRIVPIENARPMPNDNEVAVRVINASPDAPAMDVGIQDITQTNGDGEKAFQGLEFIGTNAGAAAKAQYITLPGNREVNISLFTAGSDKPAYKVGKFSLQAGKAYTVVASGSFSQVNLTTPQAFAVFVAEDE